VLRFLDFLGLIRLSRDGLLDEPIRAELQKLLHPEVKIQLSGISGGVMLGGGVCAALLLPRLPSSGWRLDEINIKSLSLLNADGSFFEFLGDIQRKYSLWMKTCFLPERGYRENQRMQIREASLTSKRQGLRLEFTINKYSHQRFCAENMQRVLRPSLFKDMNEEWVLTEEERLKFLTGAVTECGSASSLMFHFPQVCALHLVVELEDGSFLLTQGTTKKKYNPGRWSLSLEEQLCFDDFMQKSSGSLVNMPQEAILSAAIKRALKEELGVFRPEHVNHIERSIRCLGLLLEGDLPNTCLVFHVPLPLNQLELKAILRYSPRIDYEFIDVQFLSLGEMIDMVRGKMTTERRNELFPAISADIGGFHPSVPVKCLLLIAAKRGPSFLQCCVKDGLSGNEWGSLCKY
jgi:uncharacterized protein YbdZ (MbtH family)